MKSPMIISLGSKNVVFVQLPYKLHLDLATARRVMANLIKFTKNKFRYLIIDVSNLKSVTIEARKYLRHPAILKDSLAVAIISSSPLSNFISNVLIKSAKHVQARSFPNIKEALEWIMRKSKPQA